MIPIVAVALTDPGPLIERLGLRGASAEQSRLVLNRAASLAKVLLQGSPAERAKLVLDLVKQVSIDESAVTIAVLKRPLLDQTGVTPGASTDDAILVTAAVGFRRRAVETKLVLPAAAQMEKPGRVDAALVKAIARGRLWFEQLAAGQAASLQAIADRESVSPGYVSRLLPLAFLAPDIVEAILQGHQPADLSSARLTNRLDLPFDWAGQRELIGG